MTVDESWWEWTEVAKMDESVWSLKHEIFVTFAFPKTLNPEDRSNQLSYWVIKFQMTFQHPRKNVTFGFEEYGESYVCVKSTTLAQNNPIYHTGDVKFRWEWSISMFLHFIPCCFTGPHILQLPQLNSKLPKRLVTPCAIPENVFR